MRIPLQELPSPFDKRGTYGKSGRNLPKRARKLDPGAARSLIDVERAYPGVFHYSDMFRSAEGSIKVRRKYKVKKGRFWGLFPGFSGHGFGLSTDHMVSANMKRLAKVLGKKRISKREYDEFWEARGWYCHRRDHVRDREEWHYNYFGIGTVWSRMADKSRTTGWVLEKLLKWSFGPFRLTKKQVQLELVKLDYYVGEKIDGIHGRKTRAAIRSFQLDATLRAGGVAGKKTQRVLMYMAADFG